MARQFHACTHTTFAPTIAHGGTKINVIPDRVELADRHPHAARPTARPRCEAMLDEALGDLADRRSSSWRRTTTRPRASPIDTPLWDALGRVTQRFYEGIARSCPT